MFMKIKTKRERKIEQLIDFKYRHIKLCKAEAFDIAMAHKNDEDREFYDFYYKLYEKYNEQLNILSDILYQINKM